ncbi:hypothetical protein ABT010_33430, partial [Streptomyces sp. NPDC002668]|uniref:hypothetical protein n=1 Tax=Streptomyces sp. NPDC002668 TaxID=3154422 RepID=UPI003324028E
LSLDPVYGGNANPYEYVHADPLNKYDLDGRRFGWIKKLWRGGKRLWHNRSRYWSNTKKTYHGFMSANRRARSYLWKNRWKAVDYSRAYQSRGSFIGGSIGAGMCAYQRAWGSCVTYIGYGFATGGMVGFGYGWGRWGWKAGRSLWRRWRH